MTAYELFVDDNYHYLDEESRYSAGTFDSYEEALAKAKAIVDEFLQQSFVPGMRSRELFKIYIGFGEDPFIVPSGDSRFSAWEYARERSRELCRDEDEVAAVCRYPEWPAELRGFREVIQACVERKDLSTAEHRALKYFRRAIESFPKALPAENSWYWLRIERGAISFTVYLYDDRFDLSCDIGQHEEAKCSLRFFGTGRMDRRDGNAAATLEKMRDSAHSPEFTIRVSGG